MRDLLEERFESVAADEEPDFEKIISTLTKLNITQVGEIRALISKERMEELSRRFNYGDSKNLIRKLEDILLHEFRSDYIEAIDSESEKHRLKLRLRWIQNANNIYTIKTASSQEQLKPISAARAVRKIVELVVNDGGEQGIKIATEKLANVGGKTLISQEKNATSTPSLASIVDTKQGQLFVVSYLNRSTADTVITQLVKRIQKEQVRVEKAGDLLVKNYEEADEGSADFS
ncbi:hypothetical protein [Schaalia cardiffensis]|uniref:hypothetical protein n=1 Tax=Schaalia cardiffensis TaxID=181487 RepID=UPI002AB0B05A|nr:hypothetical protein [Schaalia cardiffensis]